MASPRLAAAVSAGLQEVEAKLADGRTVKAALAAGYVAFQLGGGPWYGYWNGVIPQVVEGNILSTPDSFAGRDKVA